MKRDRSGVSEVVGAIMLVLIVVMAASSFAIFISQYQESAQAQRLDDQRRAQEDLKVISIVPVPDADGSKWESFNFTIASLHNERSEITRITLNDHTVREFTVWRESPYTLEIMGTEMDHSNPLFLEPREQISISVDLGNSQALYDAAAFSTGSYVKIDLFTDWLNSFSKSFAPPSSVATHSPGSWYNVLNGQYEYYVTLNGRSSVAYDGAYIMSWNWTVKSTNITDPMDTSDIIWVTTGSVCRVDFPFKDAFNEVTLTVTDNFGMIGRSTIMFYN